MPNIAYTPRLARELLSRGHRASRFRCLLKNAQVGKSLAVLPFGVAHSRKLLCDAKAQSISLMAEAAFPDPTT